MGDLSAGTAVEAIGEAADGRMRYRATLSSDWEIWGPNGGYLAAVMLRAAGERSRFTRPATFTCHYHGVAAFEEVELAVEVLRAGRVADSMRVTMTQDGRSIADAMLWCVADEVDGLRHDAAPLPDVPAPDAIESVPITVYPFWSNFDRRPLRFATGHEWFGREPSEPSSNGWFRYLPTPAFDDPWVDAGRLTILLDTLIWPAAAAAYREDDLRYVAPSLDFSIQFHRMPLGAEWLYVEAVAPVADGGLVGGTSQAWARDGRLLATARQQMLCRPVPSG